NGTSSGTAARYCTDAQIDRGTGAKKRVVRFATSSSWAIPVAMPISVRPSPLGALGVNVAGGKPALVVNDAVKELPRTALTAPEAIGEGIRTRNAGSVTVSVT